MANSPTYETWFDKGVVLQDEEKYEEALACFQEAVRLKSDFIPAWVYQGITLEQLQRYEEAIASYDLAIQINPDVADLWYNKGATLCNLLRYKEGLECFDKVLEIDPNNAICQTARSLTLAALANTIKIKMVKQTGEEEHQLITSKTQSVIAVNINRDRQLFEQGSHTESISL